MENLTYKITSLIPGFPEQSGAFVVDNQWPGKTGKTDYPLGPQPKQSQWNTCKIPISG
jgi:hypothetical protein